VLDYVGAIVADTDHVAPGGSIDRKYLLGLISDVAGDVAGSISNAAGHLAAGRVRSTPPYGRRQCVVYLPGFLWVRLRSLTPGPPPFSSVNSTPAASKARRTAKSLAAVIDVSSAVSSARRIVVTPTDDAFARSAALQRMRARAARIWALVRGEEDMLTYHFLMHRLYHMEYSIRAAEMAQSNANSRERE
jgi:hypothetical protein